LRDNPSSFDSFIAMFSHLQRNFCRQLIRSPFLSFSTYQKMKDCLAK
jgi:hypothetical protein